MLQNRQTGFLPQRQFGVKSASWGWLQEKLLLVLKTVVNMYIEWTYILMKLNKYVKNGLYPYWLFIIQWSFGVIFEYERIRLYLSYGICLRLKVKQAPARTQGPREKTRFHPKTRQVVWKVLTRVIKCRTLNYRCHNTASQSVSKYNVRKLFKTIRNI